MAERWEAHQRKRAEERENLRALGYGGGRDGGGRRREDFGVYTPSYGIA